jgi:hypothetical protein
MAPLRKRMLEELQLRNLSETTVSAYLGAVTRFAKHFGKSPEQLGPEQVRQYLLHLINDKQDTWIRFRCTGERSSSSTSGFSSSHGLTRRLLFPRGGSGCRPC